ncbi:MAG: hypothetical protein LQ351_003818 [Letrouitia transgressa]|nr:MAG: hypothetical protein LQ351_003818 [Letrouitia transgressa]
MADALRQKIALGPLPPLPDVERSFPNSPAQSYHSEITEAGLDEKDLVKRQARLCLGLFLSSLELTIIGTALVAITDSLQGFDKNSWIVTAYLLTYTGFLIILAKLSDIFGRKALMLTTLSFFVIFSVACGAAQTLSQLSVIRR